MDEIEQAISGSLDGLEGRGDEDPGDSYTDSSSGVEAEGAASGTEGVAGDGEKAAEPAAGTAPAKADLAKIAAIEDKLAKELGIDPKRNNKIPYDRVKQITANREKAIVEKVAKAFGISEDEAKALTFDGLDTVFETHHTKKVGEYETRVREYQAKVDEMTAVEHLIMNDPDKFLRAIAVQNPAYEKFLTPQAVVKESEKPVAASTRPPANYKLPDGSMTYDMEGIQQLFDWQGQQLLAQVNAAHAQELEAVRAEYRPLIAADKARTISTQSGQKAMELVEGMRKSHEGFAENEKEILAAFMGDKRLSIEGAYNRVMIPKLKAEAKAATEAAKASEQAGREKTLAELKKAKPVETSVAASGVVDGNDASSTDSIEDAIRQSIAHLKR